MSDEVGVRDDDPRVTDRDTSDHAPEVPTVVGGLSALGAGLYSIGIPKDSILKYETALKADQFVVVAHGTLDDVTAAKRILERTGALSVDEHRVPGAA